METNLFKLGKSEWLDRVAITLIPKLPVSQRTQDAVAAHLFKTFRESRGWDCYGNDFFYWEERKSTGGSLSLKASLILGGGVAVFGVMRLVAVRLSLCLGSGAAAIVTLSAFTLGRSSATELPGRGDDLDALHQLQSNYNAVCRNELHKTWAIDDRQIRASLERIPEDERTLPESLTEDLRKMRARLDQIDSEIREACAGCRPSDTTRCARYALATATMYAELCHDELRRALVRWRPIGSTYEFDPQKHLGKVAYRKAQYLHVEGLLMGASESEMAARSEWDIDAVLGEKIESPSSRFWPSMHKDK